MADIQGKGSQGSQGGHQGTQQGQSSQGRQQGTQQSQSTQGSQGTQQYLDPVCGMHVDPKEAADKSSYQGQTYYFCSQECRQEFDRSPQQFAKRTA